MYRFVSLLMAFGNIALSLVGAADAEAQDVVFTTPFAPGERPTVADFYYNGRALGSGRESFEEVIQHVARLPEGTSIVWGPNYARCGACSGREPACLPKFLYPELWTQLQEIVKERKLTLSSSYPGPHIHSARPSLGAAFPQQVFVDREPENITYDAILDWEVGAPIKVKSDVPAGAEMIRGRLHRFSSNKIPLAGIDRAIFLDRLAQKSSVLIRLTFKSKFPDDMTAATVLTDNVVHVWKWSLAEHFAHGNTQAAIVVPPAMQLALQKRTSQDHLRIDWRNFHGPETPENEVLYLVNGAYVGRGDEGIDRILERVDRLQAGSKIMLPQFQWAGRMAVERLGIQEIKDRNALLEEFVPFPHRKEELLAKIAFRKLQLEYSRVSPGTVNGTVLDWHSGDQYASLIASTGRIVHHDEQPEPVAIRLGWVHYTANHRRERILETTAGYTINDAEVGEGVDGFAKAMEQIAGLPEGSVVQVNVCLHTKGPFVCPLIYEGHRHFERTGFEPYFGMFEWLIDVTEKRKLKIHWLPDEAGTCADCELNR